MANNVKPTKTPIFAETEAELESDAFFEDETTEVQDSAPERIEFRLNPQMCGERLDKVISRLMPEYSRSRIQQWIDDGFVTVDGKPGKGKQAVLGHEVLIIEPQTSVQDLAFEAEDIPLNVVFEDDTLIVIHKPAGMVVHPAAGNWTGTLLNGLLHRWPALKNVPRAGIVHRLDKETSGLMVVAKTLTAQTDLVRQLQERTVSREYYALVWGAPNLSGTIEAPIARNPRDRLKMCVSRSMFAKPAVTHFRRLATGMLEKFPVSLVLCKLETGRTHQIRVHMQHHGFALVGDPLYGKSHLARFFPRQALHAKRLGLIHPDTGEECLWEVDLADDLQQLLEQANLEWAE